MSTKAAKSSAGKASGAAKPVAKRHQKKPNDVARLPEAAILRLFRATGNLRTTGDAKKKGRAFIESTARNVIRVAQTVSKARKNTGKTVMLRDIVSALGILGYNRFMSRNALKTKKKRTGAKGKKDKPTETEKTQ